MGRGKFCARDWWNAEAYWFKIEKFRSPPRANLLQKKVERCRGGRDAHSREGSHVLEGISCCQNLQGRAHLSQQASASGRWSVPLDQHQDKLDYTPMTQRNKSTAQLSGCRTDGVTTVVVQNNDVRCVDVSVWRGVPF